MDSKGETARQPWHPNHGLAKLNLPLAKKVPEVPRLDTEQLRAPKLLPYSKAKVTVRKGYWRGSCVRAKDYIEGFPQTTVIRPSKVYESAAMTSIPAKVLAVGKEANKHRITVRIVLRKYRGSFNTLKFGENKPLLGSCHDGQLDLIYCRDPGLKEGEAFPLWTIQ